MHILKLKAMAPSIPRDNDPCTHIAMDHIVFTYVSSLNLVNYMYIKN